MRLSNSTKSKHETEDGVYIVESIIGERVVKKQRFYKVRWEGFSPNEDSWEPESNLSSVRTLIKKFQLKQQSISTLRQRSSKKEHSQSVIEPSSNKPSRRSLHLHKCKMTKSRVGHFEYVPQNELVAAKTKYFDDIRNGKVDLISNDLYSRVKTRRRCCADTLGQTEESNLIRPSSLIELNDCSSTYRGTPSRYSAPSTPKTFAQCTDVSIDECVSAISDPPSSSVNLGDQTQVSVNFKEKLDLIGQQSSSIIHHLPRPKIVCQRHIKQSRLSRRYRRKQVRLARIPRSSGTKKFFEKSDSETAPNSLAEPEKQESVEISEPNTAASKLEIAPKINPQQLQYSGDSPRSETDINDGKSFNMLNESSVLTQPRQTVSSSVELVSLYFDLVNQCNHSSSADGLNLSDLPVVKPLDDGVMLSSESELVTAINNQYWTILASQPIEKLAYDNDTSSSSRSTNSQNCLVAAVIGGEGRPFLLRRMLQPGNRSDFIDPISGWPLLVIAVYFGRVHAAQVLLESGAQPDASILVGGKLRTALGVAITTGNVDMASLLILSGANFYKVEENTTALKFIIRLLQAVKSNSSYESTAKAPAGSLAGESNILSRFHLHSSNPELMPIIQPPEGVTIPRSPFDYLLPTSSTNSCPSIPLRPFDGKTVQFPTADALSRLYELISCHHARLSLAIDSLVRRWLSSVRMVLCSLVMPCQWINLCEKSFTLSFSIPRVQDLPNEESALVLFLIHGIVTPPGVYHVWLEEDGPCFVGQVMFNNVEQRALGRRHFVSTLHPLDKQREEQLVSVRLTTAEKGVCIAAIVIRLKPTTDPRAPNNCTNTQETTNMPRLRSLQSVSGLRQRLH